MSQSVLKAGGMTSGITHGEIDILLKVSFIMCSPSIETSPDGLIGSELLGLGVTDTGERTEFAGFRMFVIFLFFNKRSSLPTDFLLFSF